jgi:hypothetical protein
MVKLDEYGYVDNPANGLGIVRARTLLGNLRVWDIPRKEEAIEIMVQEIGQSPIPGLYMLFDERNEKKVYIGQTESLKNRLTGHLNSPEDKIRNWDRAIVVNDGRNASQSDLNDENIRLTLENYLVNLFKLNKYRVVTTSSRTPSLNITQVTLCNSFKGELIILLTRKNKITKVITERNDNEVYIDEVKQILAKKKHKIDKWGKVEAVIDGVKTFIRAGSPKPSGWQVTFRGGKADSFKTRLNKGDGCLLMPRGPVVIIPLKEIKEFVSLIDEDAFKRDTIDVFIKFDEDKILLVYKGESKDVTKYAVQSFA